MAIQGLKINELTEVTTLTDSSVIPTVKVEDGTPAQQAGKVTISTIKNYVNSGMQAELNAGSGIVISGGVVSLQSATTSSIGGVMPDGSSIVVSGGILSAVAQGGSAPVMSWYQGNSGSSITIADTSAAQLVKVYRNGILLQEGNANDYTISGTTLTLATALIATDKITTEVF